MVSDPRESFLVLVLLEEVEDEVQREASQHNIIDEFQEGTRVELEGNVEHRREAGVTNDNQDGGVKHGLPLAAHADDEVFGLEAIAKGHLLVLGRLLVLFGFGLVLIVVIGVAADVLLVEGCRLTRLADHLAHVFHAVEQLGSTLDLFVLLQLVQFFEVMGFSSENAADVDGLLG